MSSTTKAAFAIPNGSLMLRPSGSPWALRPFIETKASCWVIQSFMMGRLATRHGRAPVILSWTAPVVSERRSISPGNGLIAKREQPDLHQLASA